MGKPHRLPDPGPCRVRDIPKEEMTYNANPAYLQESESIVPSSLLWIDIIRYDSYIQYDNYEYGRMIIKAIAQEVDQKERIPECLLRLGEKRFFTSSSFCTA